MGLVGPEGYDISLSDGVPTCHTVHYANLKTFCNFRCDVTGIHLTKQTLTVEANVYLMQRAFVKFIAATMR